MRYTRDYQILGLIEQTDCSLSYLSLNACAVWKSPGKSGGTKAKIGIYGRVAKRAKVVAPLRDNRSRCQFAAVRGGYSRAFSRPVGTLHAPEKTLHLTACQISFTISPFGLFTLSLWIFRKIVVSIRAHLLSCVADILLNRRSERCLPRLFERQKHLRCRT